MRNCESCAMHCGDAVSGNMQHDAELLILCNALRKASKRKYAARYGAVYLVQCTPKASKRKYAAWCGAANLVQCTAEAQYAKICSAVRSCQSSAMHFGRPVSGNMQPDAELLIFCNALRKTSKRKYAVRCGAADLVHFSSESQ